SKEGVLAPSAARLRAQFAALVLVMLLAAALAWIVADRVLVGPVERLLGQVDTLAQEHALPEPAPRSMVREFGDLHGRFHDIARRLSERAVQRDAAMAEMGHQKDLLESVLQGMAEG